MSEPTYKKIEVVGTSDVSIEGAVNNAIATTGKTIRNLRWFEIDEIRGSIDEDQVNQWQVGLKLAFTIDSQKPDGAQLGDSKTEDYSAENTPVSLARGKKK